MGRSNRLASLTNEDRKSVPREQKEMRIKTRGGSNSLKRAIPEQVKVNESPPAESSSSIQLINLNQALYNKDITKNLKPLKAPS